MSSVVEVDTYNTISNLFQIFHYVHRYRDGVRTVENTDKTKCELHLSCCLVHCIVRTVRNNLQVIIYLKLDFLQTASRDVLFML